MRISIFSAFVLIVLNTSCSKSKHPSLLPGLWKVDKVEVVRNNELRKVISCEKQYWDFRVRDSIAIMDSNLLRACLLVKVNNKVISNLDPATGIEKEQYAIDLLNKKRLELSTSQNAAGQRYNIIYYFIRVDKTDEKEVEAMQ